MTPASRDVQDANDNVAAELGCGISKKDLRDFHIFRFTHNKLIRKDETPCAYLERVLNLASVGVKITSVLNRTFSYDKREGRNILRQDAYKNMLFKGYKGKKSVVIKVIKIPGADTTERRMNAIDIDNDNRWVQEFQRESDCSMYKVIHSYGVNVAPNGTRGPANRGYFDRIPQDIDQNLAHVQVAEMVKGQTVREYFNTATDEEKLEACIHIGDVLATMHYGSRKKSFSQKRKERTTLYDRGPERVGSHGDAHLGNFIISKQNSGVHVTAIDMDLSVSFQDLPTRYRGSAVNYDKGRVLSSLYLAMGRKESEYMPLFQAFEMGYFNHKIPSGVSTHTQVPHLGRRSQGESSKSYLDQMYSEYMKVKNKSRSLRYN